MHASERKATTVKLSLHHQDRLYEPAVRAALSASVRSFTPWFAVLIPYKSPPSRSVRNDGEVRSWATNLDSKPFESLGDLYQILSKVILEPSVAIYAIQVREDQESVTLRRELASDLASAWIIPHIGSALYLRSCLTAIQQQTTPAVEINVCLDQPADTEIALISREFSSVNFFCLSTTGLGPYPGRHLMAQQTRQPQLVFQDSDDIPTANRQALLSDHLQRTGADMTGSHELRVDTINATVQAIRFPLDVNLALSCAGGFPLLFPTMMLRRSAYFRAGGLSTHLRFGLDTQFILRAHLNSRLVNVDEFLYLRRRREGSLTTSPDTALGTPLREEFLSKWKSDSIKISNGELLLEQSSLRVSSHPAAADLEATILDPNTLN